jgi:hypothetical protein
MKLSLSESLFICCIQLRLVRRTLIQRGVDLSLGLLQQGAGFGYRQGAVVALRSVPEAQVQLLKYARGFAA